MLVTFRVENIVSFCVKTLLHFALKSCYILRQKLLHFGLMLHFASKVVTFRVNVTFCGITFCCFAFSKLFKSNVVYIRLLEQNKWPDWKIIWNFNAHQCTCKVAVHYLSFFGQIKAFIFSKRFLFQPNVHQITAADTMIRFWTYI